jgi:hypothetical protein
MSGTLVGSCEKSSTISSHFWNHKKESAGVRNILFQLDLKDGRDIFLKQEGKCIYTDLNLNFGKNPIASLDRINSKIGYVDGNVQWVHKTINRMKWVLPENDFLRWCWLISNKTDIDWDFTDRVVKKHCNWNGCGEIANWFVSRCKDTAKRKKKDWDNKINADYLWNLYSSQKGRCFFSGTPIVFPKHAYARLTGTASLDRIDNNIGYVPGNVQFVHKEVNQMRGALNVKDFIDMCSLVVEKSLKLKRLAEVA